jgi:hypothetical protein
MAFNNFLNASNPPAEAPMPTTGNRFGDLIAGLSIVVLTLVAFMIELLLHHFIIENSFTASN